MKLIIVGSGRCVWSDLEKLQPIDDVMCVNDVIMHYPGDIDHCFSLDAPMLRKWWAARRPPLKKQFPKVPRFHTAGDYEIHGVEKWDFQGGGTSGLAACFCGLSLGYSEIILAGIPIDNSGHYFDPPWIKTNFQREIADKEGRIRGDGRRFWVNAAEKFNGRVKSMSGFTKDLLGDPEIKKTGRIFQV